MAKRRIRAYQIVEGVGQVVFWTFYAPFWAVTKLYYLVTGKKPKELPPLPEWPPSDPNDPVVVCYIDSPPVRIKDSRDATREETS